MTLPTAQPPSPNAAFELFERALDVPPHEREAWVRTQAAPPDVEREVLELLANLLAAGGAGLTDEIAAGIRSATDVADPVPERIGAFRILGVLAEGGMGRVYLAEQELAEQAQPVRRQVALKLSHSWLGDPDSQRRFQLEQRALARMNHEAIAKIYDAGFTATGQPFLAMELVEDAMPLVQYCDHHRLDVATRIQLLQQVCAGVGHAHQKRVIHRDLKPANVLVTHQDGRHVVKIVDFGIARAEDLPAAEALTRAGMAPGTLGYMAPEQANPTDEGIDTRADVYSLGVLLFELLTGELPFALPQRNGQGLHELLRAICEDDPPRPSARLRQLGQSATGVAASRDCSPTALARALRRDLDWIVVRALAKERERRYQSPAALAADLQRFLDHQPVEAGPPTVRYRLAKLLRRRRAVLAASAAIVLVAAAAIVANVAERRRREAERVEFRARAAADDGRWQEASDEAEAAIALGSDDEVGMLLLQWRAADSVGMVERAAELGARLRRARDLGPHAAAVALQQAMAEADSTRVREHAQRALDLYRGGDVLRASQVALAEAHVARDLAVARAGLERALAENPRGIDAASALGPALLAAGEIDAVLRLCEHWQFILPKAPEPHLLRTVAFALAGQQDAHDRASAALQAIEPALGAVAKPLTGVLELERQIGGISAQSLAWLASKQPRGPGHLQPPKDIGYPVFDRVEAAMRKLIPPLVLQLMPRLGALTDTRLRLRTLPALADRYRFLLETNPVTLLWKPLDGLPRVERAIAVLGACATADKDDGAKLREACRVGGFTSGMPSVSRVAAAWSLATALIARKNGKPGDWSTIIQTEAATILAASGVTEDELHGLAVLLFEWEPATRWNWLARIVVRWEQLFGSTPRFVRFRADVLLQWGQHALAAAQLQQLVQAGDADAKALLQQIEASAPK